MANNLYEIIAKVAMEDTTLDNLKKGAEFAQAVLTTIAIIIGGIWTYLRFIKNRLRFPRAELSHTIIYKPLRDKKALLRINLKVLNKGDVLLPISNTWTRISQILPMGEDTLEALATGKDLPRDNDAEIKWPELGTREISYEPGTAEIEPGESEMFHFDYIVSSDVKVVHIYSFFTNLKKREAGWPCITIINLNEKEGSTDASSTIATEIHCS